MNESEFFMAKTLYQALWLFLYRIPHKREITGKRKSLQSILQIKYTNSVFVQLEQSHKYSIFVEKDILCQEWDWT